MKSLPPSVAPNPRGPPLALMIWFRRCWVINRGNAQARARLLREASFPGRLSMEDDHEGRLANLHDWHPHRYRAGLSLSYGRNGPLIVLLQFNTELTLIRQHQTATLPTVTNALHPGRRRYPGGVGSHYPHHPGHGTHLIACRIPAATCAAWASDMKVSCIWQSASRPKTSTFTTGPFHAVEPVNLIVEPAL